MIDVIDYGGGNIGSLTRCLERLDVRYQIVNAAQLPDGKNPLIFPGVGAFGAAMENLSQQDFSAHIKKLIEGGTPYLGICIGLQVLFDSSEEAPGVAGLGVIPGQIVRFPKEAKVPQIGWNHISPSNGSGMPEGHVYFVNAYYPQPSDDKHRLYDAQYTVPFCAAVQKDNVTAFQFHPEKSGEFGHQLVQQWIQTHDH